MASPLCFRWHPLKKLAGFFSVIQKGSHISFISRGTDSRNGHLCLFPTIPENCAASDGKT